VQLSPVCEKKEGHEALDWREITCERNKLKYTLTQFVSRRDGGRGSGLTESVRRGAKEEFRCGNRVPPAHVASEKSETLGGNEKTGPGYTGKKAPEHWDKKGAKPQNQTLPTRGQKLGSRQ